MPAPLERHSAVLTSSGMKSKAIEPESSRMNSRLALTLLGEDTSSGAVAMSVAAAWAGPAARPSTRPGRTASRWRMRGNEDFISTSEAGGAECPSYRDDDLHEADRVARTLDPDRDPVVRLARHLQLDTAGLAAGLG